MRNRLLENKSLTDPERALVMGMLAKPGGWSLSTYAVAAALHGAFFACGASLAIEAFRPGTVPLAAQRLCGFLGFAAFMAEAFAVPIIFLGFIGMGMAVKEYEANPSPETRAKAEAVIDAHGYDRTFGRRPFRWTGRLSMLTFIVGLAVAGHPVYATAGVLLAVTWFLVRAFREGFAVAAVKDLAKPVKPAEANGRQYGTGWTAPKAKV